MALFVKGPEVGELGREGTEPSLIEQGVEFCRVLRARPNTAGGKLADKAFVDSLYVSDLR